MYVSDVIMANLHSLFAAEMQEQRNSSIVLLYHYYHNIHVNEENACQARSNFFGLRSLNSLHYHGVLLVGEFPE